MCSNRTTRSYGETQYCRTRGLIPQVLIPLMAATLSTPARADSTTTLAPTVTTGVAATRPPLPQLPKPAEVRLPRADEAARQLLEALLNQLTSTDEATRRAALNHLTIATQALLPALADSLARLSEHADKPAMKELLLDTRRKARASVREAMKAAATRGKVVTPDYLEMVLKAPKPADAHWKNLVRVLAISRMLTRIGTTPATRELINVYVRFGEFLRVDTQLQLQTLGDKALAALIETQRHPAPKIAEWAKRRLQQRDKDVPSAMIETQDPSALSDILRAYGRIKDPDAGRILTSFCNSERHDVRQAAREGVVLMGDVSNWALRDAYERLVGKRPSREWAWDRTARELFAELDWTRLGDVYRRFDEGQAALNAGNLDGMKRAYDELLARSPTFERQQDVAEGYLRFAEQGMDDHPLEALDALRRAERLNQDAALSARIESLRLTLEARGLLQQGLVDQVLYRRAMEFDPTNEAARRDLNDALLGAAGKQTRYGRYAGAAAILLLTLVSVVMLVLRRRSGLQDNTSPQA